MFDRENSAVVAVMEAVVPLTLFSEFAIDVSCAVKHSHYLDPAGDWEVEEQIRAKRRERPRAKPLQTSACRRSGPSLGIWDSSSVDRQNSERNRSAAVSDERSRQSTISSRSDAASGLIRAWF